MPTEPSSAGIEIPEGCQVIEVRVRDLRQLFNAIDPSFHERDLDPGAEEFIVNWSKDLPTDASLALVVYLEPTAGKAEEEAVLPDAIHEFFGQRAAGSRRRLGELFRRGRIMLAIGLVFLGSSIGIGDAIASYFRESRLAEILRQSLLIGGWVAMWRPLETFLYDWWPIRADARLFDRLSAMPVRIVYKPDASSEAWPYQPPSH